MKKYLLFSILAASGFLSGCLHSFQNNEQIPLSCSGSSAWSNEIIATAEETYLYAILANNSYDNHVSSRRVDIDLPSSISLIEAVPNDDVGLAYNVYLKSDDQTPEVVIAFRGSEPGWLDWFTGNVRGKQLGRALEVFENWKSRDAYSGHEFSVTGDSLGGSLATQVSLCHPVKIAVSLDTSPRFKSTLCKPDGAILGENNRHSITERGEILKWTRLFGREATQTYTSLDCQSEGLIGDHNVYGLARCLTRIASERPDSDANLVIDLNADIFSKYPASTKSCVSGI